jgi:AAA+ ATPase superfamily predicted ATPase
MVRAFAILGGVPAYLRRFADDVTLPANIEQKILTTGEFLYDEPRFLLLQELRDPNRYFAILEAIAGGHTRLNEIAQSSGISASSLSFYVKTLQELGLVTRAVPATEKNFDKSKLGLYQLTDHYFRFWFRFVYPNRSLLERGETGQVLRLIEAHMEQFTGAVFETICREAVWRLQSRGQFPFAPVRVGNWWDRNEEIDLVAVGADAVLLGECKWTNKPLGTNVLADLKQKGHKLRIQAIAQQVHYALFARSGFTSALQEQAQRENVLLVDLPQLIKL